MNEDQSLIERFKQGDEAAFDRLVDKYSGRAYQIAYSVLKNREDSQEVAQDTFIRIYRALKNFRFEAEFTTWMYRIVMNLAKNKYRWNKCRGSQSNISIDAPLDEEHIHSMELPDSTQSPTELNDFNELQQQVETELNQLPELYRTPLILKNVQDLSYEEIAQLLHCKMGTVKSRIARGRDELRKRLGI